jgi:predicted MFS family arabinose efflux permease
MGAVESILRAAIATMVAADRRGSAYGVFNTGYGICWFAGSAICGRLYDHNLGYMVAFATAAQICSIPFFLRARNPG